MNSELTALIPAAGLGTRMGVLGGELPKALIDLDGQTLIENAIAALKSVGVTKIIIVVGHLGARLREFIYQNDFGVEIEFVNQDRQLGLAHAIAVARDLITTDFLILCPDNIFSDTDDLREARRLFHERRPTLLMVATVNPTTQRDRARYFTGELKNPAPHLYEYRSSKIGRGIALTSTGCSFFAREALNYLPSFDHLSSEVKFEEFVDVLVEQGPALLYLLRGTRYDLSTPEDVSDYLDLRQQLKETTGSGVSTILINHANQVLLQHRDDNPNIRYPNHWSLFGGTIDQGETPYDAAKREIIEEIGYDVRNLSLFREFVQNDKREFAFVGDLDVPLRELTLNEGQGMAFVAPTELGNLLIRPDDGDTLKAYFGE